MKKDNVAGIQKEFIHVVDLELMCKNQKDLYPEFKVIP
jgi:hypothetical protein